MSTVIETTMSSSSSTGIGGAILTAAGSTSSAATLTSKLLASSLYPNLLLQRLLTTESHIQFVIILSILYVIEFGKTLAGPILTKVFSVLLKLTASMFANTFKNNPAFQSDTWNNLNQARNKRKKSRGKVIVETGPSENYDDIYANEDDDVPIAPIDATSLSSNSNGTPPDEDSTTAAKNTANDKLSKVEESTGITPESFKTFDEDRKSVKGSKGDIDKLRQYGYNRYRYVSHEFRKRNHLIPDLERVQQVSISALDEEDVEEEDS